jgi:hypothetical protein
LVSLIGTGLTDTGKQSVRFTFGKYKTEVSCSYDLTADSLYCATPNFDDVSDEIIYWPLEANVEVTLDGKIYLPCEQTFLIYCKIKEINFISIKNFFFMKLRKYKSAAYFPDALQYKEGQHLP